MTTHQRCLDSFLSNEEDARAIEDAIKAAIKAVMYVLCNINDNKIRQYKLMVSQRDTENERLRIQMKSAERELISLRRYRRTMERGALVDPTCSVDSGISSEENSKQGLCVKPGSCDGEEDMLGQPVWSKESTSPCARMTDQVEHQGWGTTVDASLVDLSEGFRCQSRGERVPLKSDGEASQPVLPPPNGASGTLPVKEEPHDFETVRIKLEVCDHGVGEDGGTRPVPKSAAAVSTWPRDGETPPCGESQIHSSSFSILPGERTAPPATCLKTRMSNREKLQRFRARIRADPEKYQAYREMDRRRYQMRKKSIKDLPEQCQKLQREAWRQAARRHRARKKSCPPIGPHINLALNVEMPLDHTEVLQSWK
ncbi:hypothetical protein SKAU_G00408120 [Synaphobranchus kaupii]|uniref:Uncharacterized protein n=1 Tax=Synaphobranchus kaupii TaxID=118154 RepID=A0A9Q1IB18_SYNKA|nr:hypothetical protein SKAU_G00408120 [Synaphobranchus kaupii]